MTKNKWPFLILGLLALGGVGTGVLVIQKQNSKTKLANNTSSATSTQEGGSSNLSQVDIDFLEEESSINFDEIGTEANNEPSDVFLFEIGDYKVALTKAGQLEPSERVANLNNLLSTAVKDSTGVFDLDFEEADDLFSTEVVGDEVYRKMYTVNLDFDVRKPIVSDYQLSGMTQERLKKLGETKSESIGYVYFDYGYANNPKSSKVVKTKTTLGRIDFSEVRYSETMYAIAQILSSIPESMRGNAVFLLDGHADRVSDHEFNQILSENRALAIRKIMVQEFKIKENQILAVGHSWDNLAVNTREACAENRRVEIRVLFFNE